MCGEMVKAQGSRPTTGNRFSATPPGNSSPKTNQYYYRKFYIQQPDSEREQPAGPQGNVRHLPLRMKRGVYGFPA